MAEESKPKSTQKGTPGKSNSFLEVWHGTLAILRKAAPVKKLALITVLLTILASLFQLAGLGLVIPVLNGVVDPNHYEALLKSPPYSSILKAIPWELDNKQIFGFIIFMVLVFAYLENLFLFLGQAWSAKLSTLVSHRLRSRVTERYLGFGKAFFDRSSLGELQVLLTSLITHVGQHLHFVSQLVVSLCFCGAFLLLMVLVSWKLTLLAFVMLPLTHFCSIWLTAKLKRSAQGEVNNMLNFSSRSLDVLQNLTLTRLSGMEKKELEGLTNISDEIRRHGENTRTKRFLIPRVVDCINTTGIILLACGAIFIIFKVEPLSIGRLSVFFISLRRFTSYVQQALVYWSNCVAGVPHMNKVLEVFSDQDKHILLEGSRTLPELEEGIRFRAVDYQYQEGKQVLSGIDLDITPGEMLAIVGPTGSGKTTLLNLIPRFMDPTSGKVEVDGVDLKDLSLPEWRKKIAVVSQSSLLFQDSLRNNLCYGTQGVSEEQLWTALENAQLADFVNELDRKLDTRIGKEGVQLSGGERQRLSIARAILRDPEILLLDEATSALDAETEDKIQKAVDTVVKERTVIVVAHRLATVVRADRVCVLEEGRVVEIGSPEELKGTGGVFQRYCELQNLIH